MSSSLDAAVVGPSGLAGGVGEAPVGERYYRHPGDVLRVAVWGLIAVFLAVVIQAAPATSDGVTADVGSLAGKVAEGARELTLALAQVGVVVVPAVVTVVLVVQQRWRRLGTLVVAAGVGAAVMAGLQGVLDLPGRAADAVESGTWMASTSVPSLAWVAALAAASTAGKPWLSRSWRRTSDLGLAVLALVLLLAGTAAAPSLALAVAVGVAVGSALLAALGAPNRRPTPADVADGLRRAGFDVADLVVQRATGGRAQIYVAGATDGRRVFLKVFSQDSRDADVLYRTYRSLLLRGSVDDRGWGLRADVEHEALLGVLARRGGVRCPDLVLLTQLPDGSMVLALEELDGRSLDAFDPGTGDESGVAAGDGAGVGGAPGDGVPDDLLDQVWVQVEVLHAARLGHRALRAANVLVTDDGPVITDFGFAVESATERNRAIDRAELLASLAGVVGPRRAVASAARVLDRGDVASAQPYLQPLALSAATRSRAKPKVLAEVRDEISEVTGEEAAPLERLVRVRPRTVFVIGVLALTFYVLLPQLANVGDSFEAIRDASWGWVALCVVMSFVTYLAGAVGLAASVPDPLPLVPNVQAQLASSFVNRVTPVKVGGMALNVRFMQKTGIDSAVAVTGVGLNALAGVTVHMALLALFLTWANREGSGAFSIPSSSTLLLVVAVVLAVVGVALATAKGRRLFQRHVVGVLKRSTGSIGQLARRPAKLIALIAGSAGVTMAYIAALAAAVAAFPDSVGFAQVGAVYLGASVLAAAAPTPGGLGAVEAALVAALTGVGMPSGPAVAAVLTFRLATYWLPILPGWLCFHLLERRGLI